jgi:hypothetical protein
VFDELPICFEVFGAHGLLCGGEVVVVEIVVVLVIAGEIIGIRISFVFGSG